MSYGYALLPDYNNVFNGSHDNSSEGVFEVQYTALNQKGTDNFEYSIKCTKWRRLCGRRRLDMGKVVQHRI